MGMVTDNSVSQPDESLKTARNRIRMGPEPAWVESCPFPGEFKTKSSHLTYLLFDQQINAELGQTFFHAAVRLESMQAVQNQSPWRLDFEPRHQQITLHSIKVWRGESQVEQADLTSARVVDRDHRTHDRLALLLMLEDIRPGDILEWSYTIEDRPLLLSNYCASLFTLPVGAAVGKMYFSARFDSARAMQWKAWVPDWQPIRSEKEGEVILTWAKENFQGLAPETNTPDWYMNYPWIQISDCPDWGTVARAYAGAWEEAEEDPVVAEIAAQISAGEGTLHQQVERAIQLVQNEYRYLETDAKLDGQSPAAPGIVARRRYGESKDLSFFLVHLLEQLGAQARLVLVNTALRQSLAELLPSPGLFNHLLVEYEIRGDKRWVDATHQRQTSALNPASRDYGIGLPLSAHAAGLQEQPKSANAESVYELTESILLDTFNGWSWLGVVVAASGRHAEELRLELERDGAEVMAKKRLRQCVERFTHARRVGEMTWRDDRAANQFFLAEIFEIKDFLTVDPKTKWYQLHLPNDYTVNLLQAPDLEPRRAPFALPHPCNVVHTIELFSVALPPSPIQQWEAESEFVHFNRVRKTFSGNWTMKLTLATLTNAVAPDALEEYQKALREIREHCGWTILVPPGDARPHQRSDFANLPTSWTPTFTMPVRHRAPSLFASAPAPKPEPPPEPVIAPAPAPAPVAEITSEKNGNGAKTEASVLQGAVVVTKAEEPKKSRRRKREKRVRKHGAETEAKSIIFKACLFGLVLIVLVFLVAKYADHLHIFKMRPTPPVPTDDLGL